MDLGGCRVATCAADLQLFLSFEKYEFSLFPFRSICSCRFFVQGFYAIAHKAFLFLPLAINTTARKKQECPPLRSPPK